MAKRENTKKERADKYEEKLKVNLSFEQLIELSVKGNPKPKRKEEKKNK